MHRFQLADIRTAWDSIKQSVEQIRVDCKVEWRSEDVYAQCYAGHAFLWMCDDGFMVVKIQCNQFTLAKELFVWICWSGHAKGISEYMPDIKDFAAEHQCKKVVFGSPRKGFSKLADQNQWRQVTEFSFTV